MTAKETGTACRAALEAIRRVEAGDMRLWQGHPELLWLRYLYATRQNDYNRARCRRLDEVDGRESLQYTRRTLQWLDTAPGDWTPEERDTAARVLCWAEAAKGGMPREREQWQKAGISLLDHAEGSAALFLRSLPEAPGPREGAVSLLIRLHGALGQYLQGEVAPESGTFPFASPRLRRRLEELCAAGGYPFRRFCRELALVSVCVLAGVSPELARQHREAIDTVAAGGLLPALSPARRAARLCGAPEGAPVRLSPRAEALLAGRDLWYGDGVLRAMGPLRGPALLDALAASLPEDGAEDAVPGAGERAAGSMFPGVSAEGSGAPAGEQGRALAETGDAASGAGEGAAGGVFPALAEGTGAFLDWRPGAMISLKSLQDRLYFYAFAGPAFGERRVDHCVLAMAERAMAGGAFAPTEHIAFSFRCGRGEIALVTALTPIGEAIDRFYQTLVMSDITHDRAVLAVFDQLGYRPDIFARVGNEDQYLLHMNSAADDKSRLLDFIGDGDRVLDVGPGGGVMLDLIAAARPRCRLWGADISAEVCRRLTERIAAEGLPWRVIHSDFLALDPAETGRFEVVLFCSIIHEIFSYGSYRGRRFNKEVILEILRTAAGLLEPGGRIVIRDGVAAEPERNVPVLLRFTDEELEALARDYLRQFRGFPLKAVPPEETGAPHLYRMPMNSAMELLYTVTWGRESLPFEVEEWYGYYSEADWRALAERMPELRLIHFTQYLQPGYVEHLAGRVVLTGTDGQPLPFPNSNMVAVFRKEL